MRPAGLPPMVMSKYVIGRSAAMIVKTLSNFEIWRILKVQNKCRRVKDSGFKLHRDNKWSVP